MKPLSDQGHYEVLEIEPGTSDAEIERAYQLARTTYTEDSLAGYSVLEDADVAAIRERIELAYRVLSDVEAKRSYDAELVTSLPESEPELQFPESEPAPPLDVEPPGAEPAAPMETLDDFEEEGSDYDGPRLRRSRMRRGMDLVDVAGVTKVSVTYLRFLEEERFLDLPARVYVRGFVGAYAGCVGLDMRAVTDSYMRRYDQTASQPPRRSGRGD